MRSMTKSPLALAREALQIAKAGLNSYSSKFSPRRYTQHQLFAVLVLRQFLKTDYRGHHPNAQGLVGPASNLGPAGSTSLFYLVLRRAKAAKKRAFESLLNAVFDRAEGLGMLSEKPEGAIGAVTRRDMG